SSLYGEGRSPQRRAERLPEPLDVALSVETEPDPAFEDARHGGAVARAADARLQGRRAMQGLARGPRRADVGAPLRSLQPSDDGRADPVDRDLCTFDDDGDDVEGELGHEKAPAGTWERGVGVHDAGDAGQHGKH